MKKSLQEKMEEAKMLSIKNPDVIYYVVDKKRCKPKVYSLGWCAVQAVNYEGYHPVATFKNGVQGI